MFTSSPKTGRALRDDKENWREGDWVTKTGKRKERIILSSTCSGFEGLSGTPAPKLLSSVPPTPPPPPLAPGQDHAFFEQYPGASFALPGILDFRLIVTSYVSRCVSWHPLSQKKRWLKFTVSEGELVKSAFWLPVRQLLSIYWGQDILLTWSEKRVLNLNK